MACGCRLPVTYSIQLLCSKSISNRIGIWLPVASCQFSIISELASVCRLPISYLAFIGLKPLKSNWHLAASCQLPIHKNLRIGIWLPVANSLDFAYWHLDAVCKMPFHLVFSITLSSRIGIWLPVASCQFT